MSKRYSEIQKQDIINRYFSSEKVNEIAAETGISRSTIYNWVKAERKMRVKRGAEREVVNLKSYNQLKEHTKRLEGMLEILKTCGCGPYDSLTEKLSISERLYHENKYSVRMICEALDIPRGTFYNHIFRNKRGDSSYEKRKENLRIRIRQVYEDSNQIYGSPKIAAILKGEGIKVSKEYVRQLMREMGLESIRKGAKKQYTEDARKMRNIVNRAFDVDKPNQVWVSDITYFNLENRRLFICVIMDLFARKVIACRIGKNNSTQLVKETFKDAYESRAVGESLIFHTDQGSNYRSRTFRRYLEERNVTQSFSKAGVPYDNSVMESFFSTMKQEELYRYKYRSEKEFRARVETYIDFYNCKRPHKSLRYKTPEQVERKYADAAMDCSPLILD
ncbi:MAG: IS3 family transposase [Candidatus Limivicinus sp.]